MNSVAQMTIKPSFGDYTEHKIHQELKFPMMEGEDFEKLVADIKARGLDQPILVRGKVIIDGRNRYLACVAAGYPPRFSEIDQSLDELAIIGLVVAANLLRRHLTVGQRAMIGNGLRPAYEAAAKERQRYGGVIHGKNASPQKMLSISEQHARSTDGQLGKLVDVGKNTISKARVVDKPEHKELADAVRSGKMKLNKAYKEVRKKTPTKPRAAKADPQQHPRAASFKPSKKYPQMVRTNPRAVFPPECREELIKMLKPIIRSLYEQGKRVPGVTLLPGNIQSIASQLEKCLDEWCTAP